MGGAEETTDEGGARILWLWQNLIGQIVVVETVDGILYEGVFVAKEPSNGMGVVLAQARRKAGGKVKKTDPVKSKETLSIQGPQIVKVVAADADVRLLVTPAAVNNPLIDPHRQLVKWDAGGDTFDMVFDEKDHIGGAFDQFKVNEEKFEVKSTYREEVYTTALDVSQLTEKQKRDAERMARDIEKGKGKGQMDSLAYNWADDYDEEDQHSAVIRKEDPAAYEQFRRECEEVRERRAQGTYIPPSKRKEFGLDDASAPNQNGKAARQQEQQQPTPPAPQQQPQPPPPAAAQPPVQPQPPAAQPQQVTSATLNPHRNLAAAHAAPGSQGNSPQYRRDGQLQVRQDGGGGPTSGIAMPPPDCYNTESSGQPAPSPPPPAGAAPASIQPKPAKTPTPAAEAPAAAAPAAAAPVTTKDRVQDSLQRFDALQLNTRLPTRNAPQLGTMIREAAYSSKPQDSNARRREILALKKDREIVEQKLNAKAQKAKKETEPTQSKTNSPTSETAPAPVTTPASEPAAAAKPTGSPSAVLNPNAAPYAGTGDGDAEAARDPAPEPEWKPELKINKEGKFISEIIAEAIYKLLKPQSFNPQTKEPLPGDSETFNHEWPGDDFYWDEEDEEQPTSSAERSSLPPPPSQGGQAPHQQRGGPNAAGATPHAQGVPHTQPGQQRSGGYPQQYAQQQGAYPPQQPQYQQQQAYQQPGQYPQHGQQYPQHQHQQQHHHHHHHHHHQHQNVQQGYPMTGMPQQQQGYPQAGMQPGMMQQHQQPHQNVPHQQQMGAPQVSMQQSYGQMPHQHHHQHHQQQQQYPGQFQQGGQQGVYGQPGQPPPQQQMHQHQHQHQQHHHQHHQHQQHHHQQQPQGQVQQQMPGFQPGYPQQQYQQNPPHPFVGQYGGAHPPAQYAQQPGQQQYAYQQNNAAYGRPDQQMQYQQVPGQVPGQMQQGYQSMSPQAVGKDMGGNMQPMQQGQPMQQPGPGGYPQGYQQPAPGQPATPTQAGGQNQQRNNQSKAAGKRAGKKGNMDGKFSQAS